MAAESDIVLYQRGKEEDESDAWDDTALIKAYDDAVSAVKAKLAQQYPEYSPHPESSGNNKPKRKKKGKTKPKKKQQNPDDAQEWKVGDLCQAVYSEDGEIYAAEIIDIDKGKATCTVQYLGYGNEEDHPLSSLMSYDTQTVSSQEQKTETASETENAVKEPLPPPPSSGKRRNRRSHHHGQQSQSSFPGGSFPPPPPQFGHMPPPPFGQYNQGFQASGPQGMQQPPVFPNVPSPPPWFTDKGASDENQALYGMLISWYMSGYHTGYYQGLKHSTSGASGASGHGAFR